MTKNRKKRKLKKSFKIQMVILVLFGLGCLFGLIQYERKQALIPSQYRNSIRQASENYHVPIDVIYGVIKTESNFKEEAKSKVGACGLMQIMPDTFEWLIEKRGTQDQLKDIFDSKINIDYGVYYLSYLYELFEDWDIAFAAYNAGPNVVYKWLNSDGTLTNIPYSETDEYIKKVNNAIKKYNNIE